jgi:hypothetical protein
LNVQKPAPRSRRAWCVALALGHRDRLAGIEQVERVRSLEHALIRGQRELRLKHPLAFFLVRVELPE